MIGNSKILLVACGVVTVVAVGAAVYFYQQYYVLYSQSPAATQQEVERLVQQVGRLIVLPPNEKPTVATVADPSKLVDQPFFANAKKGDKVLIYTEAKKAILYSQSQDKIVEVAPVTLGPAAATAATTPVKK